MGSEGEGGGQDDYQVSVGVAGWIVVSFIKEGKAGGEVDLGVKKMNSVFGHADFEV